MICDSMLPSLELYLQMMHVLRSKILQDTLSK